MTVRPIVRIFRKADLERERIEGLKLELDYQLDWLSEYIASGDRENIENTKVRLQEIQSELETLETKK
ncbi:hypothetical protein PVJ1_00024 [Psychrobacillus phage PVJ1]|nr:hypothetical protein PVJ1_00024 [Psychrobacillus phage PVJ1]